MTFKFNIGKLSYPTRSQVHKSLHTIPQAQHQFQI
ncbi:hypothetical protein I3760_10G140300 [Carya illinoinensis]|nr:hypothetical protein I3760_10G140300 [Carya illinoinensis]